MRQPAQHPITILIVEDEAVIAFDMAATLTARGYEIVAMVPSGEAALRAAAKRTPDLAVLDISLRGAMDGIETARRLKRRHRMPILFCSACLEPDMMARARAVRPAGYLLKPFDPAELERAVAAALSRPDVPRTTIRSSRPRSPSRQRPPRRP